MFSALAFGIQPAAHSNNASCRHHASDPVGPGEVADLCSSGDRHQPWTGPTIGTDQAPLHLDKKARRNMGLVRLAGLTLAEGIKVDPDGPVTLFRAWPEWWSVSDVPGDTTIPVVVIIEHDLGADVLQVRLTIEDGHGAMVLDVTTQVLIARQSDPVEGAPAYSPLALGLEWHVEHVGPYVIRVHDPASGAELGYVRFTLRLKPHDT